MAKTLAQIEKQIQDLKREADALRAKEVTGVIERIRDAIKHYNLTPRDLFGDIKKSSKKARTAATTKSAVRKPPAPAKYRNETGLTWSGIGKRPNWFKAAIAAGKTTDELLIKH